MEEWQQQFLQATFWYDATHFIMEIWNCLAGNSSAFFISFRSMPWKDVILPDTKFSSIIISAAQCVFYSVAGRQKIKKGVTGQFSEKVRQKSWLLWFRTSDGRGKKNKQYLGPIIYRLRTEKTISFQKNLKGRLNRRMLIIHENAMYEVLLGRKVKINYNR